MKRRLLSRPGHWFLTAIAICLLVAASFGSAYASGSGGASKPKSGKTNYTIKQAGDVSYVRLERMWLPIFKDFKQRARIWLGVDFETKRGDEAKVTDILPRLQAKYTEFASQRGDPLIKGGKLQLRVLRLSLQTITDKTIGKGVAAVLIGEAVKR
jgi:hypothetical protein